MLVLPTPPQPKDQVDIPQILCPLVITILNTHAKGTQTLELAVRVRDHRIMSDATPPLHVRYMTCINVLTSTVTFYFLLALLIRYSSCLCRMFDDLWICGARRILGHNSKG